MDAAPPAKRSRRGRNSLNKRQPARVRPPSLVSLPVELVTCIIDQVEEYQDLLSLSETCRALYRPCSLRALVAHFGGRGISFRLFCLQPAPFDKIGIYPFLITDARMNDHGTDVELSVIELAEDFLDLPSSPGPRIVWTSNSVYLRSTCLCELCMLGLGTEVKLSWRGTVRGRLSAMTSERMRNRFVCPECEDTRIVECGSWDFASRWPGLPPFEPTEPIPCPRCTITYEDALRLVHEILEGFSVARESDLATSVMDDYEADEQDSSDSSSDWDPSDDEGEAQESDSDIDEPSTEQDDLTREFEASLRALAETWSVDDSDDSQSICSSARSLDNSDDSDDEATSAEDEGPLDMIDLRAEAEAVQRGLEDEADEKCWYDQELAASDEQQPDWWFPYGFPPGEWEWLEGYGPTFSDDEWSDEWRRSREREYFDDWGSERTPSSDGGGGPGQRYDGELGWTGGKGERDEGWYDAQEERGTYWW